MTVDGLLAQARTLGVERLDAQLLLAHRLGVGRPWVLAHGDAVVADDDAAYLAAQLARRADSVPLAYLTGWHEFHGLALEVTPAVLDPRPDTETLVDWALELVEGTARVLDLGTGSGAIALALKHGRPAATVHASDACAQALAVAVRNARRLGLDVHFHEGDWWQAVPGLQLDLAVSNPPYLSEGDPHLPALRHEPEQALIAGADGLQAIDAIVRGAPGRLRRGGWLLLEHGADQADAVRQRLRDTGFVDVSTRCDLAGRSRCSGGRLA